MRIEEECNKRREGKKKRSEWKSDETEEMERMYVNPSGKVREREKGCTECYGSERRSMKGRS